MFTDTTLNFNSFLDISERQLDISIKKGNMMAQKILFESALSIETKMLEFTMEKTEEDDISIFYENQKSTFIEKISHTIQLIIDAIKEFFHKINDKITEMKYKSRSEAILNAIKSKIRSGKMAKDAVISFETKIPAMEILV